MGPDSGEIERINRGIERFLNRLKAESPANYRHVQQYASFLQASNRNPRTMYRQMFALSITFRFLKKDAKKATKNDLVAVIGAINQLTEYKPATKDKVRVVTKQFYKHLLGDDEFYPEQVRWLKSQRPREERFKSGDLLTEEEIKRMIDASDEVRDRALVAVLFDTGARPAEILDMRICDVDLESTPPHVSLSGKTGLRSVAILMSASYLAEWINLVSKSKTPQSLLWLSLGHGKPKEEAISDFGLNKVLKTLAVKAGISKPVTAYLFRHSHLSAMATRVPESVLRRRAGWTGSSTMPQVYIHLSGKQDDEQYMKAHGLVKPEEEIAKSTSKVCPKCKFAAIQISSGYCPRCGSSLSLPSAINEERVMKIRDEAAIDPKEFAAYLKGFRKWKAAQERA